MGLSISNRDPLSELAECLVAALLPGTLATGRTQKDWDVLTADGERVQVKYLANPSGAGTWMNEHLVRVTDDMERYALVVFEDLRPIVVHVLPCRNLAAVCQALGKLHGDQERTLQLTKANHECLLREQERFRRLGVRTIRVDGLA